ncbi:MAG: hypothetical protein A2219_00085 [Elusimicrobia bacterium RIFOXYA2_FULL_50_26]|nr:MAG: hypothetical protein A2219_00085 [Elusimicrobia bacterium RIFOXYA2_FULL_50_26]
MKKSLVFISILAALLIFFVFFALRLQFLEMPLRVALKKIAGQPVTFSRVEYRPFNRITVSDLTVGRSVRCRNITVYLNPIKLIRDLRHPELSLSHVNIEGFWIDTGAEKFTFPVNKVNRAATAAPDFSISWREGEVVLPGRTLHNVAGTAKISDKTAGIITAQSAGYNLSVSVQGGNTGAIFPLTARLTATGNGANLSAVLAANHFPDKTITANILFPRISYKSFSLSDSSGTLTWRDHAFSGEISNAAARLSVNGTGVGRFSADATFLLSQILAGTTGYVKIHAEVSDEKTACDGNIGDIIIAGRSMGTTAFSVSRSSDGAWSGSGTIAPSGYNFGIYLKNNYAALTADNGKKARAYVTGQLSPPGLTVKINDWPLEKLPGIYPQIGGMQGSISVNGLISGDNADMLVSCNWLHPELRTEATVQGTLKYSLHKLGEARLSLKNVRWGDYRFSSGKVHARLTPENIEINDFSLHANKGTLSGQASAGIGGKESPCNVKLQFHRFPAAAALVSGPVEMHGTIRRSKAWEFSGNVQSGALRINDRPANKVSAFIELTPAELLIGDFRWESLAHGSLRLDRTTQSIEGSCALTSFPLSVATNQLNGTVNGNAIITGTVQHPAITLSYSSKDTVYREFSFSHHGKMHFRDKELYLDKVVLSSDGASATVTGKAYPRMDLSAAINKLPGPRLATLLRLPVAVKGAFTGSVNLKGEQTAPLVFFNMNGTGVTVDNIRLDDLSSSARLANGRIIIDSLVAKFSDSELRLHENSYIEPAKKKFNVVSEWRNVRAGPADLNGTLRLNGSWEQMPGQQPSVRATMAADDFWINEHNIHSAAVSAQLQNGVLTFLPVERQELALHGHVVLKDLPSVLRFERLSIGWGNERNLLLDGEIGENTWDFMASGKAVSAAAVAGLINSPVSVDGDMDFTIVGKGSVHDPQMEGSINISNGFIEEAAYDNINVQFSARDNTLSLIHAKLIKDAGYTITAGGTVPLYLSKESRTAAANKPVDVEIKMDQGTLGLLTSITPEITSASGEVQAQLRLTGTIEKPSLNGYCRITGGRLSARNYVQKMSNINATLLWKDNLLSVKEFSGRMGDGAVRLTGSMAFKGFLPGSVNLALQTEGAKGVPIFVQELPIPSPLIKDDIALLSNVSRAEPRFLMRLEGPAEHMLFSGWAELENAHFTYPSRLKHGDAENPLKTFWPRISWDFELRAGKNAWYDNELVSVNAQGAIKLSGKGAFPTVDGRVESIRGNISYLGTEFKINRAVVEIVKGDVVLEAEAEAETYGKSTEDNDTIRMYIDRARIGLIKPRFVSKNSPALSSEKALVRATGIDAEMYSATDRDFLLRQQLVRIFDSTLATPLAKKLLRTSGLADTFRVQHIAQEQVAPQEPGNPTLSELLYGTKYSMEKYLGDRFLVGYSVTFDQLQNKLDLRHEIEVSYRLQRNIFVRGTYEIETRNPLRQYDRRITIEQQWRFGWPQKK